MSYASTTDLAAVGVSVDVTSTLDPARVADALDHTSETIDSYLRRRYQLPVSGPTGPLKRANAILAASDIVAAQEGYNPEDAANRIWEVRAAQVIKWLEDIASGRIDPGFADATPEVTEGQVGPILWSDPPRGW